MNFARVHRCVVLTGWMVALQLEAEVQAAPAVEPNVATAAPVELPPMLVEESISSAPWYYVKVGGCEFLSRCSVGTTRDFVAGWLAKLQLVPALVPEEFLARMDVPAIFVLYAQDLKQTVSAEIQRELQAGDDGRNRVNIAPNMRLSDRDLQASIVYLDEALFDPAGMSIAPGHIRFLLRGRVPELPAWLIEGIERTWRRADFVLEPITLRPLIWNNDGESSALASDPARPRALLPAGELFASDAVRASEHAHPRRNEVRASEQELFFRWAILSSAATRAALWKFAARAAEGPVNEEIFEQYFGFGYSELRDRLSDYVPRAVGQSAAIGPGPSPDVPAFEVERATPNQIARIRGEWERLAIGYVQHRLPRAREPYLAQARRTLHRAYDAGDRDPRLLATLGLCEIDAGNAAGAPAFLEPAVALGVVRPRAYYELARIRFDNLRHGVPETKIFSFTELAPVFEPLRRALRQAPPLPEVFVLFADAWARCEMTPNAEELAELETGARLFARRPAVGYAVARAFARHGRTTEATALLDATSDYAAEQDVRAAIARLRAELMTAVTAPRDLVPGAGR